MYFAAHSKHKYTFSSSLHREERSDPEFRELHVQVSGWNGSDQPP